jgi:uncharacterized protein (DUF1684 family)
LDICVVENLIFASLFILVGIVVYRFHRQIFEGLRRFDADNRARIESQFKDRSDATAHFRHTLGLAEEQVEPVSAVTVSDERTATPVTRYLFEGETFVDERDAKRAREDKVRAIARAFYVELPAALAARRGDGKLGR